MGYQEYVYKIDNVSKFAKNRRRVDCFVDNECYKGIAYSIVEFKEDFRNIKKGIYLYVCGDRCIGARFLNYVTNKITKGSSYSSTIESALDSWHSEDEVYGEKLKDLFKSKSTEFGRVIYDKQPRQPRQSRQIQQERGLY